MTRRNALLTALLAGLVVSGFLFFSTDAPDAARTEPAAARSEISAASAPGSQPDTQPQSASAETGTTRSAGASEYDPEQDDGQVAFRANANGQIVMDEKTRLDLERLYALFTPQERETNMTGIAATLPSEAARQLYQLMEQYQNYQAAMHQVFPPGREMTSVEQGVSQIDGMHGLRVQYFGEQATEAMFGAEERLQRELYRLMENERDPGLTLEEKAERAQRIYQQQHPG